MERAIVLRFMEIYGKHPTWNEYVQYAPYYLIRELTYEDFRYEDFRFLTASPYLTAVA